MESNECMNKRMDEKTGEKGQLLKLNAIRQVTGNWEMNGQKSIRALNYSVLRLNHSSRNADLWYWLSVFSCHCCECSCVYAYVCFYCKYIHIIHSSTNLASWKTHQHSITSASQMHAIIIPFMCSCFKCDERNSVKIIEEFDSALRVKELAISNVEKRKQ